MSTQEDSRSGAPVGGVVVRDIGVFVFSQLLGPPLSGERERDLVCCHMAGGDGMGGVVVRLVRLVTD